ncbi:hypothetical protein [Bosea sp. (in: a-proteobacteria)]|uniref:hypothetical protein n=1 Tax=Bosea sp. (in: a-proteobacteria) TaxID=1871050 RepID=UPI002FCB3434
MAPGNGALASAGAFGAGFGDVVDVCASALVESKAQKIDVRTTFRIVISLWVNGIFGRCCYNEQRPNWFPPIRKERLAARSCSDGDPGEAGHGQDDWLGTAVWRCGSLPLSYFRRLLCFSVVR